jgi:hypothetical protein
MTTLPITYVRLVHRAGDEFAGGDDSFRWHVWITGDKRLVVELGGAAAVQTGLTQHELDAAMLRALDRFAAERSGGDLGSCPSPVVLAAAHFL